MTERFADAMQLLPIFAPAGPSLSAPDLSGAVETSATASAHVVPIATPTDAPPRPAALLGRLRRVIRWLGDAIKGVS